MELIIVFENKQILVWIYFIILDLMFKKLPQKPLLLR